jgi:hypothetical protein
MRMWLHNRIDQIATWPVAAILLILGVLCLRGFDWRGSRLGSDPAILDVRSLGYSPEEVHTFFDAFGPTRTNLYAWTEITLDVGFAVIYSSLLCIFIIRLYPISPLPLSQEDNAHGVRARLWKWLAGWGWLVPLLAGLVDMAENISVAVLAWSHPHESAGLARLASVFTVTKFVLLPLSILLVLGGGVRGLMPRHPAR